MEGIETSLNGSALDIQVSPLLEEEEGEGEGCYQHQAERNLTSNDHGDEHESGVELIIDAAALTPIHGKKEIEHEYEVVSPAIISVSSEEFMQINLPESNSNSRSNSSQGNTHASLASAGPTASPILASSMPTRASLGKGPIVAAEAHGNINANAKINKASNQKLNETSDTEQSSIMSMSMSLDTSHFDLSSSLGNISLFNDAVEGLGDLASMSGIGMFATSKEGGKGEGESSESQTQTQTQMQTVEDFTEENDEPGRIRSDNAPFDEEGGKSQIHNHNVSKETLENMSAIARMRYQQKYGTMDTMIEDDKSLRSRGSSSRQADDMQMPYDEIQKERHERWRRLKAKVQREEAEAAAAAAANPTIMPHNTNARHQVQSKSKRQEEAEAVAAAMAAAKRTSNSTPSTPLRRKKPLEDTSSNVEDGTGLQRMFQPFADALQQSQSVMFDAADIILGTEELDDDDDCDSAYYSEYGDNDVSGSDSSSCAEDDYDNDDDSDSPRRRKSAGSTRLGSRQGRGGRYNDYETSDSEYSHETELSERHGRPKQKGANKTFLEDITSDGIYLVHHIPTSKGSNIIQQDVCVNLQISDTEGGCIEPNFVWEVIEHRNRNSGSSSRRRKHRHKYEEKATARETISLFDVSSVQRATDSMSVNIHSYPHANPENSILLTLNNGNVQLFEANNEIEARRFIHGLRWIEARLTFNIIVGNISVCSEMLSVSKQQGICELTSEIMVDVTNQLVEKSSEKLST